MHAWAISATLPAGGGARQYAPEVQLSMLRRRGWFAKGQAGMHHSSSRLPYWIVVGLGMNRLQPTAAAAAAQLLL